MTVYPETVVLEEDGTVVDEDEILLEVCSKVLIVLTSGQTWQPDEIVPIVEQTSCSAATPPPPSQPAAPCPTTSQPPPITDQEETQSSMEPETRPILDKAPVRPASPSTSIGLSDLPLPDFSFYMKQCLRNKESAKVWYKAVDEAANFYLAFYPNDVDNQKSYKIIRQKLHNAYPDIKRDGELPWSTFTRGLSQKMRAERLSRKRKSVDYVPKPKEKTEQTSKKFKADKPQSKPINLLTDADYVSHVNEMKKEWDKTNVNESHVKLDILETESCHKKSHQNEPPTHPSTY